MKIELAGWSSKGLRSPDLEVSFKRDGRVPHVAFVQMPNGTGKTTTLRLLRAALTGIATQWPPEEVLRFRRPSSDEDLGEFIVRLDVDNRPLTIRMAFDFDAQSVRYQTTFGSGQKESFSPPADVGRFLERHFVELFVFDGEFAEELLKPNAMRAKRAIDALFQLHLLDDISAAAEEEWHRATRAASAKGQAGYSRRRNRLDKLREQLRRVKKARKEAEQRTSALEAECEELSRKITTHIGDTEDQRRRLEEKQTEANAAKSAVDVTVTELLPILRKPTAFHPAFAKALVRLREHLDKLKLPASTSIEFFRELQEQETCVCGRPLDEASRAALAKRAASFMGEDYNGVLNSLKADIGSQVEPNCEGPAKDLSDHLTVLGERVKTRDKADSEVRVLRKRLIDSGGDAVKKWEEQRRQKQEEVDKLHQLIDDIDRLAEADDKEDTRCLQALKRYEAEAVRELSEITETLDLRVRTEVLKKLLAEAKAIAEKELRRTIIDSCNSRLRDVLSRDPPEIVEIAGSLRLKGQEGASVGQTQAIGYTFQTTLLSRSEHQFPLVVDSPANPMDITVRTEIARIVPQLCRQFVALTISTERLGFVDAIHKAADGDVLYLTAFRKTEGTKHLVAGLPAEGVLQTESGVLVEGQEYFNRFDLAEED